MNCVTPNKRIQPKSGSLLSIALLTLLLRSRKEALTA